MVSRPQLPVVERCRVILDNDWAGDPDGLVALAHHLLSPANRVVAVTSSFLDPRIGSSKSTAGDGAVLARELIELTGGSVRPPVYAGCDVALGAGRTASAAADSIVAEARRDDPVPLYLVCGGPLTNVAQALRQAPDIASRLTLVWVGGSLDPAEFEYNRDTDPAAAELVFSMAGLGIGQFPLETYRRCAYSVAELEHDLGGSGRIGHWLWIRFTSPLPDFIQPGGFWPLGDSPPVLVTALPNTFAAGATGPAQGERRTYTEVDFRLIVGDMLAKLRLHEQRRAQAGSPAGEPRG